MLPPLDGQTAKLLTCRGRNVQDLGREALGWESWLCSLSAVFC